MRISKERLSFVDWLRGGGRSAKASATLVAGYTNIADLRWF